MAIATRSIDRSNLIILVAAGLLFLSFGYTEMAGSDMWWHIAAGRELVQTGTLWMVDDWSFSAHGKDWLNHEWLADLIYYAWVSAWGVQSLVYWKWLVIVATFAVLLTVLARAGGSPLAALLCAGVAAANAAPFMDVRPHLYSLLGFTLLLAMCLQRRARPWPLALLFVLWVNLHGGFFFGLLALGVLLLPWREPGVAGFRAALGLGLVALLACLLNPVGFKAVLYPLAYAFDATSPFRSIGEWVSPFSPGGIASPWFFYLMWLPLLGLAYLLPAVRRAVGVPWEGLALTALTLAMAVTSRRFIPLFGISLALMLVPLVALGLRALRLEKFSATMASLVLLYALFRLLPYPVQAAPAFHYLTAEYSYPVDMLDFVEANDISGNVFALWNWGGYIHWRTDGGLKVFVDGRADTIFDDKTYTDYVQVLSSKPGWLELVNTSAADYVLWPEARSRGREKLQALLASGLWRPIYRDAVSWLLARKATVLPREMIATPDGPWHELALAISRERAGDSERAISHAQAVLEVIPWHQQACNLLASNYRNLGESEQAQVALADCRGYFPSGFLR